MINEKEKLEFVCSKCGSNKLAYHKYVKCITPVKLQENNYLEYLPSKIDEDDSLATCNGFGCLNCGEFVEHCGFHMETERDLLDYFKMDPIFRDKQQQEYEEILCVQIEAQEQLEKEIYFEDEITKKSA